MYRHVPVTFVLNQEKSFCALMQRIWFCLLRRERITYGRDRMEAYNLFVFFHFFFTFFCRTFSDFDTTPRNYASIEFAYSQLLCSPLLRELIGENGTRFASTVQLHHVTAGTSKRDQRRSPNSVKSNHNFDPWYSMSFDAFRLGVVSNITKWWGKHTDVTCRPNLLVLRVVHKVSLHSGGDM